MAGGAGQSRVGSSGGKLLFASNIVANPGSTLTLGSNDTGPILWPEAMAFGDWLIQPVGTWGSLSGQVIAYVLGTVDPLTTGALVNGAKIAATEFNWFPLPAPATETVSDAIVWANPLYGTNTAQTMIGTIAGLLSTENVTDALLVKAPLTAIRVIVVTAGVSGTAVLPNCNLRCFAVD